MRTRPYRRIRTRRRLPWESTVLSPQGGSRAWSKIVADVVRRQPYCRLRLPGVCTIRSTTADHIIPRSHRPDLTTDLRNLRGSCQPCNRRRKDRPLEQVRAECIKQLQRKPSRALRFFT